MELGRMMSCRVYVAAMPLRASKGPAKLVFSTAYSLNICQFHHFIVIIKPHHHHHQQGEGEGEGEEAVVYDFQPRDPENIWVALAALSGRKVAGVILSRKVKVVPSRKCWFVGYAKENAAAIISEFNNKWDTHLRIGHNDCRNYTQALVQCLTAKQLVLDNLFSTTTHL